MNSPSLELIIAIKAEYESTDAEIPTLAEKYEVDVEYLKRKLSRDRWTKKTTLDSAIIDVVSDDGDLYSVPMIQSVETLFNTIDQSGELTKPGNRDSQVQILEGVKGLKKLQSDLQTQAFTLITAMNTQIHEEMPLMDMKTIVGMNINLQNAYFNNKGASVNIVNNNDLSNTNLDFFNSVKKQEI